MIVNAIPSMMRQRFWLSPSQRFFIVVINFN